MSQYESEIKRRRTFAIISHPDAGKTTAFKSKIERFGMLSIILLSWGIALFEYCFQVPANRIGSSQPVSYTHLDVYKRQAQASVSYSPTNYRDKNRTLRLPESPSLNIF